MTGRAKTLCITCGAHVDGTALNRLPNGQVCPTCRERVLASIPAPLPRGTELTQRSERMSLFDGMLEHGDGEWPPAERQY
jgi:hypothetical protein